MDANYMPFYLHGYFVWFPFAKSSTHEMKAYITKLENRF